MYISARTLSPFSSWYSWVISYTSIKRPSIPSWLPHPVIAKYCASDYMLYKRLHIFLFVNLFIIIGVSSASVRGTYSNCFDGNTFPARRACCCVLFWILSASYDCPDIDCLHPLVYAFHFLPFGHWLRCPSVVLDLLCAHSRVPKEHSLLVSIWEAAH